LKLDYFQEQMTAWVNSQKEVGVMRVMVLTFLGLRIFATPILEVSGLKFKISVFIVNLGILACFVNMIDVLCHRMIKAKNT
jgi:hypothetical protein